MYIEAECPKYSNTYLCEKNVAQHIRTEPDCTQELIINQALDGSCHFTKISLAKEAVGKLDDQHYVLSLPRPTKVQLACGRKDFNTLQRSYLFTIPENCYIRAAELTIINDSNEIKGQPLKISKIPFHKFNQTAAFNHVSSRSINLKDRRKHRLKSTTSSQPHCTIRRSHSIYWYQLQLQLSSTQ